MYTTQPNYPTVYMFDNVYKTGYSNSLLSLPENILVKILNNLQDLYFINCILTCKRLFYIGSRFCRPNFKSIDNYIIKATHSIRGICLKYEFYRNIFPEHSIGKRKHFLACLYPLCLTACACDYSHIQHTEEIKKLILNQCKIGTMEIKSL